MKPLAIDLFCGLGGWTDGLLAEGWHCAGFDIEAHEYENQRYAGELIIEDVLKLHGSEFKHAKLIVASPPCQEYSYMAMPWGRAKQIGRALRGEDSFPEKYTGSRNRQELTALFDACFRIQKEASDAAGQHIPLIVENVRGACAWVGRSRYHYGSFYLWGDVPANMPKAVKAVKVPSTDGGRRTDKGKGARFTSRDCGIEGVKQGGDWFAEARKDGTGGTMAIYGSKLPQRKAASAMIAKIPEALSRHIARAFYPRINLEYDL